jgi:hypothetical protein
LPLFKGRNNILGRTEGMATKKAPAKKTAVTKVAKKTTKKATVKAACCPRGTSMASK